jgi:transposase InsO family protein
LFGVKRQVYYRKIKAKAKRQTIAEQVVKIVLPIRARMPRIGTRKLYHLLQEPLEELGIGRDKLFSILKANHLLLHPKRSYRVTTHTHHRFYKHKDLVSQLTIHRPEQVWVSDITYVAAGLDNTYLALIADAYSKKIVGYDLSHSLNTTGVLRALQMAVRNRKYTKENLIHHSDKGIQYCSNEYQQALSKNNIRCSMTEKYDPYSNAVAERINGIIKNEFDLESYRVNLNIMKQIVAETIKIYNNERPHYSSYLLTPNQMHQQQTIKMRTYKTKNSSQLELTAV